MTQKKWRILSIVLIVITLWVSAAGLLGTYFKGLDNGDHATLTDWILWISITSALGYSAYYCRKKSLTGIKPSAKK